MSYSPPPYGYNPPSASAQDVPSLQWRQDNDNLNLLGILHYVYGGIVLLSAIGIIGYFTLMGSVFATIAHSAPALPALPFQPPFPAPLFPCLPA